MPFRTRTGMTTALAILLVACGPALEDSGAEFYVFGTLVEVIVRDADTAAANAAFAEIQQWLQSMHRDLHAWEPGRLTRLNAAFAAGIEGDAEGDIATLITASRYMERATGGRFNAAAGGLVKAWGFHTSEFPVTTPPPSDADIERWLAAAPSALQIELEENRAHTANAAVQLDFGGIAKGYAVDRVYSALARRGFRSFMINAGGDLRAAGGTPGRPWRIGIRSGEETIGGIHVRDHAIVFTSGAGQRFGEHQGERYPHILDPRTGRPARGLQSVTVLLESGETATGWFADAAATALMVAGPEEWLQVAADLHLDAVLVVESTGRTLATSRMLEMMAASPDDTTRIETVTLPPGKPLPDGD